MKTIALLIEYDGTNYGGWQIQPNAPSIQQCMEDSFLALSGRHYDVIGSGRTDAGVHARGQVASVVVDDDFPVPDAKLLKAVNSKIPNDIIVADCKIVESPFNARYDASLREYSYTIAKTRSVFARHFSIDLPKLPDPELLAKCAEIFLGEHDFTTFSKLNETTKSYVCNIETSQWEDCGNSLRYRVRADRFVYGMVRALSGAMIDCGRGRRTVEDIATALEAKDRSLASPAAPAKGLVLEKVYYPPKFGMFFSY